MKGVTLSINVLDWFLIVCMKAQGAFLIFVKDIAITKYLLFTFRLFCAK